MNATLAQMTTFGQARMWVPAGMPSDADIARQSDAIRALRFAAPRNNKGRRLLKHVAKC